jgi:O-antigen ligase
MAFVASRTRGAWLAFAIMVPFILLWRYREALRRIRDWQWRAWSVVALTAVLLGGMLAISLGQVVTRVQEERDSIEMLARGEFEQAPRTSVSWRFDINRFGLEKWRERPLFGWGPESVQRLVAESNRPQLYMPQGKGDRIELKPLAHLHNTYLEILFRFGIVGALLVATLLILLWRASWRASRHGIVPREQALFGVGALGLLIVWSLFNFNVPQFEWRDYVVLTFGLAYSFHLRARGFAPSR